jgi:hypothetical protein
MPAAPAPMMATSTSIVAARARNAGAAISPAAAARNERRLIFGMVCEFFMAAAAGSVDEACCRKFGAQNHP